MTEYIIFAGFGGQGIIFMGKLFAQAAMDYGRFVTWMPSYGAEVRGGTAHSMVVVSDSEIASPVVKEPSICVVMNQPSFEKFHSSVRSEGLLLINKSMVEIDSRRKDIDILEIPATDIAKKLGDTKVSNMVTLGALLARKHILPLEYLIGAMRAMLPTSMVRINEDALKEGYDYPNSSR